MSDDEHAIIALVDVLQVVARHLLLDQQEHDPSEVLERLEEVLLVVVCLLAGLLGAALVGMFVLEARCRGLLFVVDFVEVVLEMTVLDLHDANVLQALIEFLVDPERQAGVTHLLGERDIDLDALEVLAELREEGLDVD